MVMARLERAQVETMAQANGLKMTPQRRIIIDYLQDASHHPTAEEVLLAQRRNDVESRGAKPVLTILPPPNRQAGGSPDLMASPETAADLQTYGSF